MKRILVWAGIGALCLVGCGAGEAVSQAPASGVVATAPAAYAAPEEAAPEAHPQAQSARFSVKVADVVAAGATLRQKASALKGYVAHAESKRENDAMTASLELRIPRASYDGFLTSVKALGEVLEQSEETEELGAQTRDLAARLKAARALEARILELVNERTASLADVLAAERELAAVRTQIEELEATTRALETRTEYAVVTVHLFVSTSKDAEARVWYGPLRQDFRDLGFVVAGSLGALLTALVAIVPWVLALAALWRWRRARRQKRGL